MDKVTKEAIDEVSRRTGLRHMAVFELLKEGWTYIEELGKPPRWEHPISIFTINKEKK